MPIGGQSEASYVCNHRTSPLCGSLLVYSEDEFKAQMVSDWPGIIRPNSNIGQALPLLDNPMPIPGQFAHLILVKGLYVGLSLVFLEGKFKAKEHPHSLPIHASPVQSSANSLPIRDHLYQ